MSDNDFERDAVRGGGRASEGQQPPAVAPAAVDGMEQALDVMERAAP